LGLNSQVVSRWVVAYRKLGAVGLAARKAPGRPTQLSAAEIKQLRRTIVGKNPEQLNFGARLWTLPIIRELAERMFGKPLSAPTMSRYMGKLGLTPRKPLRRSYQRSTGAVWRWRKVRFPRIASDVLQKRAVLLFLDETGVMENAPVAMTWGVRGKRPVVQVRAGRSRINVISCISPNGKLWFRCYKQNLNSALFIQFIEDLIHDIRRPIVLVMDSHSAHVSAETTDYLETVRARLQVEFLPTYAPELNPDEHLWTCLKGLFRRMPLSREETLQEAVSGAMHNVSAEPVFIRRIFRHPELLDVRSSLHDAKYRPYL
jgi:transposase